jgi:RNA polymerase sigma-70 factor (ECF subfamily)
MTPAERVALILNDVFRYSFAEVAEIAGRPHEAGVVSRIVRGARRLISGIRVHPG